MLMLLSVALLSMATPLCQSSARDRSDLVQQMEVSSPFYGRTREFIFSAYKIQESQRDPGSTRVVVQLQDCTPVIERRFEDTQEIKFSKVLLGETPFVVVTVLTHGGSGCGVDHLLISYDDSPEIWTPISLRQSNMDGFFIGDLGNGTPGLALFEAQWGKGESHYQAHAYKEWIYRWDNMHFEGPKIGTTNPLNPDPPKVAQALKLPFSTAFSFAC